MSYKIPFTFIPGTKAKANEVNSNFSKVIDYLTELNTGLNETNTNIQNISTTVTDAKNDLKEVKTRLCINSSTGTVLSLSGNTIYFNNPFTITDALGESKLLSGITPINCESLIEGTHNIFIDITGTTEVLKNTIYKQKTVPTSPTTNDIWIDTSNEPIKSQKYNGATWVAYNKVALGKLTVDAESGKSIEIFPFNQNGYNVNSNTEQNLDNITTQAKNTISQNAMIDYSTPINQSWNTLYQATTDGFLFLRAYLNNNQAFYLNIGPTSSLGTTIAHTKITDIDNTLQMIVPIPKNYYYHVSGNGSNSQMTFFKTKGAN
ncbi:MAG: hypothetical protein PHV37_02050 [Candidatus Gastranaerophilales bacterium]|nr:hypothetical protein [Candidatus Gastranaerophilales bacterium]